MRSKLLKIGVLTPYSSIYPNLATDFIDGLRSGIPDNLWGSVQLIPEYIHQGGKQHTLEALNKLLHFHRVDIITGFASYKIIPELIPVIERAKTIALFADIGEYVPYTHHLSDYVYYNSYQYWQAEYALGEWAAREFGDCGAICMPLYESGYHMHISFQQGLAMAGSKQVKVSTIRYMPDTPEPIGAYIDEYMRVYKREKPSFIHALFSGGDALAFMKSFYESNLHKDIPLLISPHMGSEEMLYMLQGQDIEVYGASMWNAYMNTPENHRFKQRVLSTGGQSINSFTLLGYEIALGITAVWQPLLYQMTDQVIKLLQKEIIKTPRGERAFFLDSDYSIPTIGIEKISLGKKPARKMVVSEGKPLAYNSFVYDDMHRTSVSGWLNPYLCI